MLWLLIATQPTKMASQLQLVVRHLCFDNLLKLRSQLTSFARELSDIIFKYNLKEPCFGHPCYILSMVVG
jgi:hypothetical protein